MTQGLIQDIRRVCAGWRSTKTGFASRLVDHGAWPPDYLEVIEALGPGEGFVGERYLRLYPLEELAEANEAYGISTHMPGHQLFGSDGCGIALLFDLRASSVEVVEQPFIPLDGGYAAARHPSFTAFMHSLMTVPDGFQPIAANPATHGLEVHEVHPVALGGDPVDPGNKLLVAPPGHAELCLFWNRLFLTLRAQA